MTSDRAAALTYIFVCVVSLGYWLVPTSPDHEQARVASSIGRTTGERPAAPTGTRAVTVSVVPVSSPDLHAKLRPVLTRGTNVSVAAAGFRDATQFAAVAHAARNTGIPFMLLKHRVVTEGRSLAEAIRESQPRIDAEVAAELAVAEARFDLSGVTRD